MFTLLLATVLANNLVIISLLLAIVNFRFLKIPFYWKTKTNTRIIFQSVTTLKLETKQNRGLRYLCVRARALSVVRYN